MMPTHAWRIAFPLVLVAVLGVLGVFYDTARSMVDIWNSSETFAHGYIIVPIALWLIWQQRAALARCTPTPCWWGLFMFAFAVFVWLLGDLSSAQVVRHYALAAMLPAAVLTLLGWQVVRIILFPLLFLLLAVPFGDALIDPLMNWTADFTVLAVQVTGIPVFREGNTLTLPTGVWSVVEACSGVRYLIASVTLGIIYAYITYRSMWRRIAFVVAATLVPILANGVRAYMIVMIGHFTDMKYATGVDHLIYGWLFFGLVMLVLFWVGNYWREDLSPVVHLPRDPAVRAATLPRMLTASTLLLFVAAAGPAYSALVARVMGAQSPAVLSEPIVAGWTRVDAFTTWRPEFKAPAAEQIRFLSRDGEPVGVYIGYYRNQTRRAELIAHGNVLAMPEGKTWRRLSESTLTILPSKLAVRQNRIARGEERVLGWYWYWTGSGFTNSGYVAKAHLAVNRMLLRPDDSAVIVVFAPYVERPESAVAALRQFVQDALPDIQQQLQATKAK